MTKKEREIRKLFSKEAYINVNHKLDIADILHIVTSNISNEDAPLFIALLDQAYEDWDVTMHTMNHFESLKPTFLKEIPEDAHLLVPKNLLK